MNRIVSSIRERSWGVSRLGIDPLRGTLEAVRSLRREQGKEGDRLHSTLEHRAAEVPAATVAANNVAERRASRAPSRAFFAQLFFEGLPEGLFEALA